MEIPWMGFNMIQPKVHKDYWVTVHNKYWGKPKAMMLYWGEETYRGITQGIWMLNGSKIPREWEVRWWFELPAAVEDNR